MNLVSLNSWSDPTLLYQGESPVEVIRGQPGEWGLLREALHRYEGLACDTPHPQGAAVGYLAYDGSYCFGIYPRLRILSREENNVTWKRHRHSNLGSEAASGDWRANVTRAEYEAMVRQAQAYIRDGHIYQVNLAQKFSRPFAGNPYALFEQLSWRSPAPGAAFLDMGDRQILSSSPELFLRLQGRQIQTRPIKGTRPRSRDPLRDQQLAYELITDPKEQAELIMITDLERNDLGKVCEFGSVVVSDLLRLERYAHVYHLVSTVEGFLAAGVDTVDALSACFPGGSITGAPKKRAQEIIAELEPEARGIFTGAIGYIGFNGDAAFSIAIRTMIVESGKLHFHVGSGITADSVPHLEYDETMVKAQGMMMAFEEYRRGGVLSADLIPR